MEILNRMEDNKVAIENLTPYGNFETGNAAWLLDGGAEIVNDGHAMNSLSCLRFNNKPEGGPQGLSHYIVGVPGTRYDMSFWAKRSGRMDVWPSVVYGENGTTKVVHGASMLNSISDQYSIQRWHFTLPATANEVFLISINGGGNPGDISTAWVDNVEFWGEKYVEVLPDPGPHPTGITHVKNGGFEQFSDWSFMPPSGIVNGNAYTGAGCLRFPYRAQPGMQWASQRVVLAPGKSYILSFYAKRSGRMDIWAGHSYRDASGVTQRFHGPSLLNEVPNTNTYRRQEYRFDIPLGAQQPFEIFLNAGSIPGDTEVLGFVDDVILVNTEGTAPPFEEKDGWVVNVNSDGLVVRRQPDDVEIYRLSLGEQVLVSDEQMVGSVKWLKVTDRLNRTGWAKSEFISYDDPADSANKIYVKIINHNALVRDEQGQVSNSDWKLPIDRILIAEDVDSESLYRIRYRGLVRFLRKADCTLHSPYVSDAYIWRMRKLIENEEGRQNSIYFDGYTGTNYDWCHRFVDWLVLSSYVSPGLVPRTAWTVDGIKFFIQGLGANGGIGKSFWFKNQTLKRNFLEKYTEINIPHDLTLEERAYQPSEGDYIYFKFDDPDPKIVVSHVGYVTGKVGDTISTIQGNVNDAVVKKDYHKDSGEILGYGKIPYPSLPDHG